MGLVNSLEQATYIDILGFNATFQEKVMLDGSKGENTSEIQAAMWIMILSYFAIWAGVVFRWVDNKYLRNHGMEQVQQQMHGFFGHGQQMQQAPVQQGVDQGPPESPVRRQRSYDCPVC